MAESHSAEQQAQDERHKVQHTAASADGAQTAFASEQAPAFAPALLADARLAARGNAPVLQTLLRRLQRTYGNAAVQRALAAQAPHPPQTFAVRAVQRWQAARLARVPVQRITHNGTPVDITTLTADEVREHLGRLARLANGAGKGTDSEYSYDAADKDALLKRQLALNLKDKADRLNALIAALSAALDSLATATDFTTPPPWDGKNPTVKEGPETPINAPIAADEAVVVARWKEFLGAGDYCHKHPRSGVEDTGRLVSADGQRSIRYGAHEATSPATLHHFHEETWTYDAGTNELAVQNHLRRVPVQ